MQDRGEDLPTDDDEEEEEENEETKKSLLTAGMCVVYLYAVFKVEQLFRY